MAPKLLFINSTGATSSTSRQAQKKLARSHVTSKRHFEKRQLDVEEHGRRKARDNVTSISSRASDPSPPSGVSPARSTSNNVKESVAISFRPQLSRNTIQGSSHTVDSDSEDDQLRLEAYGGHLVEIPLQFPMYRMVSSVVDPFKQIPRKVTSRMRPHIDYYINILMPALHPAYTTNLVRRTFGCDGLFAQADELTVTYTSAFAATSRAAATGDLTLPMNHHMRSTEKRTGFHDRVYDWLYFKGKTIKLLNERMKNGIEAEEDVFSEPVIHAICNLVLMELFTGNIHEAQCHMTGVRRIAALWHQRKDKPMSYKTAATVIACITKLATLTLSKPATPFHLSFHAALSFPLPPINHILPGLGNNLVSKWPIIITYPLTDETDLRPILHDLAQMTRYTEAVFGWESPHVEDDSYMEYVNFHNLEIEHRILLMTFDGNVEEVIRLCCLLYINTVLVRGYPISSAIVQNVLRAFRATFERSVMIRAQDDGNLDTQWVGFEDVLLWVSFIGAHCSHSKDDQEFFQISFRNIAGLLCLTSFEQAQQQLSGFFFVDRVHAELLKKLYISTS